MATPTRIYLVTDHSDGGSFLIRAAHPAQAVSMIVRNRYQAEVASQEQIVEMLGLGANVIDASIPIPGVADQAEADPDEGQASLIVDEPPVEEVALAA